MKTIITVTTVTKNTTTVIAMTTTTMLYVLAVKITSLDCGEKMLHFEKKVMSLCVLEADIWC